MPGLKVNQNLTHSLNWMTVNPLSFQPDENFNWMNFSTIEIHPVVSTKIPAMSWYFRSINRLNFHLVENFIWMKFSIGWKIIQVKLSQLKIDGNFCACLSLLKIHPSGHLCQPFFHLFEGNRQCQIFNCNKLHQEDTSHSFSLKNSSRIGSQSLLFPNST